VWEQRALLVGFISHVTRLTRILLLNRVLLVLSTALLNLDHAAAAATQKPAFFPRLNFELGPRMPPIKVSNFAAIYFTLAQNKKDPQMYIRRAKQPQKTLSPSKKSLELRKLALGPELL